MESCRAAVKRVSMVGGDLVEPFGHRDIAMMSSSGDGLTYPEPAQKPAQKPEFTDCHTRRYYHLIWRQIIYTTPVFERMAAFSHDRMVHALAAVIERAIDNSLCALDWWVVVYIKLRAGIVEYWNTPVTEDVNGDVWDMRVELDNELRDFNSVPETMTRYLPWVMVEVWQMASYS
ncbi:hypothetical protein W97_03733 [Coniosporium apollinis CBS 100218]|uniref:Uncharacterized protein n=1 Tax=Coniosporium apollinis (strain CBS 100218) TaxID=1168221 RepID=R7YS67_CONA1|nr:uncharacterized protein W97_03733 [Coniosporium apollinis CBS 100218]EON64501.1 hypothetical protein W97_03733 [Coniosporium apollinis CBS 100218]